MDKVRLLRAVVLGAPASGKGTISKQIAKKYNVPHISTGDSLRLHIKKATEFGKEVKRYVDEGRLVPDSLVSKVVEHELKDILDESWLLDGYPRTAGQAKDLWGLVEISMAIYLNAPFYLSAERSEGRWVHLPSGRVYHEKFKKPKVDGKDDLTGEPLVKRDDDKPEVVMNRFQEFLKMSDPVFEFYRKKNVLREFHVDNTNKAWEEIDQYLTQFMQFKVQ